MGSECSIVSVRQTLSLKVHPQPFAWPPLQVNLNHETFEKVESKMLTPAPGLFDEAQHFIYQLMARDSYPRFIKTQHFQEALRRAERSSR